MDTTNNASSIEVILTDPSAFHCFKIVFGVKPTPDAIGRVPLEIRRHLSPLENRIVEIRTR
jgi:hypothetical protein